MARTAFTTLTIYRLAENIADEIWTIARRWDLLARDTIGKQIIRSADSIGANIAEGFGRGSDIDNRRFVRIARGSLNETQHFLRRAYRRGLLTETEVSNLKDMLNRLGPQLNAYLRAIGRTRRLVVANKPQTTNNKLLPD